MATGRLTQIGGVDLHRIDGLDDMEPFLTTVVSDSDLWMFVSSTGGLTAGRIDADHAILPYDTDDKLHRLAGLSGPVTVVSRMASGRREVWRPFAAETTPGCTRSLAKSVLGDRLVFEEHNDAWGLVFRATWAPSTSYGWVRTVDLVGVGGSAADIEVLDGLLDVMPAGVDAAIEQRVSNLVDAYKRSETGPWGTAAVYSVESLVTDRAEPAESLTATLVWSAGFPGGQVDLDDRAVAAAVAGRPSEPMRLVTGRPGAYLLRGRVTVPRDGSVSWRIVADTGLSQPEALAAIRTATDPAAARIVDDDIEAGSARLRALLRGADAFQSTADEMADAHHLSNVLFNSMRGGVFPYGHDVQVADLTEFVRDRNRVVAARAATWLDVLERTSIAVDSLRSAALEVGDPDLVRLTLEYLPLTFSRRHGDPSRPWNRFSIRVRDDDGREVLSYEGNWRDIFQNWEALLRSFPAYTANVVAKFVNASTIDGHNPYRISRDGVDWEVPDPDDPWSHIGYWGDHQIVYLHRLLVAWEAHEPGVVREWLDRRVFVYADTPYVIADHEAMVADPRNTITYDDEHAAATARREESVGADGQLVVDVDGELVRVGLLEKLLVPVLGKLSAFVPDGGIWMNTQRPEWNDANNALAGPGLSMVTLCHLFGYLRFLASQLDGREGEQIALSSSVATWFGDVLDVFERLPAPGATPDDRGRRAAIDALGSVGAAHRRRVRRGVDATTVDVSLADVSRLCSLAGAHLERSIVNSRRADGLYHSYNRVSFPTADSAQVDRLGPMLEGQVAVLSSGLLDPVASSALVDALFSSGMYRADLDTFLLYPPVELRPFLDRNHVPADAASRFVGDDGSIEGSLGSIFAADGSGRVWFRPEIVNGGVLAESLERAGVSETTRGAVADLYEEVFHHASFTGRSGSMYGYEGIGSVYWHMVAKLLLAVQETYWAAVDEGAPSDVVARLADAYRRVRAGFGYRKSPAEFGAFPMDCYSHTPAHAGAKQPGMTGQVKEEILTRFGELGVRVGGGRITLSPGLLADAEVIPQAGREGGPSVASFSFCSVPMTIAPAASDGVTVVRHDGHEQHREGLVLTADETRDVLSRRGVIARVEWSVTDARPAPSPQT